MAKYDAGFWRRAVARTRAVPLVGTLSRLVENQAQKVTLKLVDNLDEHDVLEQILDASKPRPAAYEQLKGLDYLLRTPWRYPPLPWGSRFGRRHEPSLFYGALGTEALFAEAAYYRLLFIAGMEAPFPGRVISQFTVFEATYQGQQGYDLSAAPFLRHEKALRDPANYRACQALGSVLREKDADVILYLSARAQGRQRNVALFTPQALRSRRHRNARHGLAEAHTSGVTFRIRDTLHHYDRAQFLVDGELPRPA